MKLRALLQVVLRECVACTKVCLAKSGMAPTTKWGGLGPVPDGGGFQPLTCSKGFENCGVQKLWSDAHRDDGLLSEVAGSGGPGLAHEANQYWDADPVVPLFSVEPERLPTNGPDIVRVVSDKPLTDREMKRASKAVADATKAGVEPAIVVVPSDEAVLPGEDQPGKE